MRVWLAIVLSGIVLAASGAAAGPAQPQRGGTAVVALGSDPDTLNLGITTSFPVGAVGASLYNGLIWVDPRGEIQPQLASSWTISPDGLQYTFQLRPNVRWHDGRPFTAADVKFTMEEVTGKYQGRFRRAFEQMDRITVVGPTTLVIRFKRPFAPFLRLLSVFDCPILPQHVYAGGDILRHPRNADPVGTGPFRFREWVRGDRIVLERNPDYVDPVYLDRLVFRVFPSPTLRVTALETGELDHISDFYLPKTDVDRLRRNPAIRVRIGQPIPSVGFVYLNTRRPPLNNVKVRQALAFAINRVQITQQAMAGLARPARGPFGDGFRWAWSPAADFNRLYPYNPERAAALLDEAGFPRGAGGERPIRLRVVYDAARAPLVAAAAIIQDNLRAVGIAAELVPVDAAVRIDRVYMRADFDLALETYTSSGDPAIGYHRIYATAPPRVPFVNASGYSNPAVDELLTRATEATSRAARARAYAEVSAILAADLPALMLFDEVGVDAARATLRGVWTGADARDRWDAVWIQK
jgi:peptide/nickel transport system substrate-binding protein